MQRWEVASYLCFVGSSGGSATAIWENKDKKTGKSAWDSILALSSQGWELVSVTPINARSTWTTEILYTFKRPVEEDKPGRRAMDRMFSAY
jgi:hypothetical protein